MDLQFPQPLHSWAQTQLWWMKDRSEGGERTGASQELPKEFWELEKLKKSRTRGQLQGLKWGQREGGHDLGGGGSWEKIRWSFKSLITMCSLDQETPEQKIRIGEINPNQNSSWQDTRESSILPCVTRPPQVPPSWFTGAYTIRILLFFLTSLI